MRRDREMVRTQIEQDRADRAARVRTQIEQDRAARCVVTGRGLGLR